MRVLLICSTNWARFRLGIGYGCALTRGSVTDIAKKPIPVAKTASTVSGTPIGPLHLDVIQRHHLQLVGIHMHIGSGVDYAHLEQVCGAMVRQVL